MIELSFFVSGGRAGLSGNGLDTNLAKKLRFCVRIPRVFQEADVSCSLRNLRFTGVKTEESEQTVNRTPGG